MAVKWIRLRGHAYVWQPEGLWVRRPQPLRGGPARWARRSRPSAPADGCPHPICRAIVLHVWAALSPTQQARRRGQNYATPVVQANYARSRCAMGRRSCALLLHLMQLTWGVSAVHGEFIPGEPYHNPVTNFQSPVTLVYLVAVVALDFTCSTARSCSRRSASTTSVWIAYSRWRALAIRPGGFRQRTHRRPTWHFELTRRNIHGRYG